MHVVLKIESVTYMSCHRYKMTYIYSKKEVSCHTHNFIYKLPNKSCHIFKEKLLKTKFVIHMICYTYKI